MGSLYVGASGLQTGQNALNTTAHNLSNIDTKGYTRQQVQQSSKSYLTLSIDVNSVNNKQVGLGVTYSRAKQVRDYFLDKTYRRESGRSMFYEVSTEVMEEVESQLGELHGEAFQGTMSDFWTAIQELTKDPASSVTQGLLVQRASELVQRAGAIYSGLSSYQDNLNQQIIQQVDKINKYGKQLLILNDQISAIEAGGIEKANDMRDARNQILDELAELTDMTWKEDMYGRVSVQIEGVDFVKGGNCFEMGLDIDPTNGFVTPFWPQNASYRTLANGTKEYIIDGAEVFDLDREISSELNTDIGGLKAMLHARGDHRADYTDIENDYDSISQSVVMNVQAEFDQMIHHMVTKINDILAKAAGVVTGDLTLADGTVLKDASYCEVDEDGYMRQADGSPIQMFSKITTDAYRKVTGQDGKEYWVYNEEDAAVPDSLYTLKNLQVNPELMQKPSMLGFRLKDGSEDKATADALKDAFTEEAYTLNPNVKKKTTFIDYYTDLVSQIANSAYAFRDIYVNQQDTVESVDNARQQVVGVSSDEELSNMIRFQNAYNASSRYINVISEMLEHIISTLGV
ncbi:MAG: flagellar hook-associated protein FlgK [Lachnospiraceae bacterium]|nr:flagellar hook-associated protein FlgK [Lachnospiraceae bacterium]